MRRGVGAGRPETERPAASKIGTFPGNEKAENTPYGAGSDPPALRATVTEPDIAPWPLPTPDPARPPGRAPLGDMPPDELRRHLDRVADWAAAYGRRLDATPGDPAALPVAPPVLPGDVRSALPAHGPERGEPMADVLDLFERAIAPGLTHGSHPSFFAYFTATTSGPAVLAETLAAATNVNTMLWRTGPAAAELDAAALGWLREWVGLPDTFWGTLTEGGSSSTLHALAAARQDALGPALRTGGVAAADPGGRLRLYATALTHSSVDKAAVLLGLGADAVRRVPHDGAFRMDPDALDRMVAEDRAAGLRPFCVVATAGTTACTSVDPLADVADIAERRGLWLHVDAAHGGPLAVLPEARPLFAGWDRADSVTMNPHKWLFVPLGCGALYTRRPDALRAAFSLVADYLETDDGAENAMDTGVALGRRWNGLKLAFCLRYFGRAGYAARFREHVRLARLFAGWVRAEPGFALAAPVPMSTVCFRASPAGLPGPEADALNGRLLAAVNGTGRAFLSPTRLDGRLVLRLVVSGLRVREADVRAAWGLVRAVLPTVVDGTGAALGRPQRASDAAL